MDQGPSALPVRLAMNALALLVVLLALAITAQVIANALDLNPLPTWSQVLPVLGKALTLNGLLDLQWHLLAVIALIPAGLVWWQDRHVRVDVIQSLLPQRGKAAVDLVGNLVFAGPFIWLLVPAAYGFAARAWRSGEGSANGGLNDLWLVKSVLPVGLALLSLAIIAETVRLVALLMRRRRG